MQNPFFSFSSTFNPIAPKFRLQIDQEDPRWKGRSIFDANAPKYSGVNPLPPLGRLKTKGLDPFSITFWHICLINPVKTIGAGGTVDVYCERVSQQTF